MTILHRCCCTLALLAVTIPSGVHCQSPSTVPSMIPTSSLVEGADPSPTMVVLTTDASEVPSSVPVQDEVDAPVPEQQSLPSLAPSISSAPVAPTPPSAPVPVTSVPPPSFNVKSDLCELNEACAALNLTGQCCPTIDEQFLYCCNGFIEPTCQRNDKCAALGLEGACCPTAGNIPSNLDGIYLDCCTTVPDACGTAEPPLSSNGTTSNNNNNNTSDPPPASCVRMAAVEYKEALSEYQNNNSAAAASSVRSVMMVIVTVLTVATASLL